jgi:hypothetical protein
VFDTSLVATSLFVLQKGVGSVPAAEGGKPGGRGKAARGGSAPAGGRVGGRKRSAGAAAVDGKRGKARADASSVGTGAPGRSHLSRRARPQDSLVDEEEENDDEPCEPEVRRRHSGPQTLAVITGYYEFVLASGWVCVMTGWRASCLWE